MEKLTEKEEEIMQVLWQLNKAFVKEVVAKLPNPKPHYNTVSTVIRKMEDKGFVGHVPFGTTFQYAPLISKDDYTKQYMTKTIHHYFDNSYKKVVSFLAQEEKISVADLKEIIQLIENK